MGPGLPGLGIASVFYAFAALFAPFREVVLSVRGKSSLRRWKLVGRQFVLALFIVGAIVGFYLGLAALQRRGLLTGSGGLRLLTHVSNVLLTVAVLGAVLLLSSIYGWWVRWTTTEESAEAIAAAHRAGALHTVIDLRGDDPEVIDLTGYMTDADDDAIPIQPVGARTSAGSRCADGTSFTA